VTKPLRIAAISFDHGHQYSYLRAMLSIPDLELVAISEPKDEQRARAVVMLDELGVRDSVSVFSDHEELIAHDDVDAVSICSANVMHHDLVMMAADAGKHVLCEKPLATSLSDATAMVQKCAESGVTLATAYPVRHAPQVWDVRARLARGELGAVRSMSLTNVLRANPHGWFIDPEQSGGGAIRDHIVHATDLMRWFTGSEVQQVYCEADTLMREIPVEDTGFLIEAFASGAIGTCDPSWNRPVTWRKWGDVTGRIMCDLGAIEFDVTDYSIRITSSDVTTPHVEISFASDMNEALLRDFATAVIEGREPCATGMDGWAGVACTEAAYLSAGTQMFVDVPSYTGA
jgi:predicted dehydrogenase